MDSPVITWYVIESDNTLVPHDEYYAGSYTPTETMEVKLQVWNNRWGQTPVMDATACRVVAFFDTVEDKTLLEYLTVKVDNGAFVRPVIETNRAYVNVGTLYGNVNDGTQNAVDNFMELVLKFGPVPNGLRNGLKNMFVDVEFEARNGGA